LFPLARFCAAQIDRGPWCVPTHAPLNTPSPTFRARLFSTGTACGVRARSSRGAWGMKQQVACVVACVCAYGALAFVPGPVQAPRGPLITSIVEGWRCRCVCARVQWVGWGALRMMPPTWAGFIVANCRHLQTLPMQPITRHSPPMYACVRVCVCGRVRALSSQARAALCLNGRRGRGRAARRIGHFGADLQGAWFESGGAAGVGWGGRW
jgi:hypothetical protein